MNYTALHRRRRCVQPHAVPHLLPGFLDLFISVCLHLALLFIFLLCLHCNRCSMSFLKSIFKKRAISSMALFFFPGWKWRYGENQKPSFLYAWLSSKEEEKGMWMKVKEAHTRICHFSTKFIFCTQDGYSKTRSHWTNTYWCPLPSPT